VLKLAHLGNLGIYVGAVPTYMQHFEHRKLPCPGDRCTTYSSQVLVFVARVYPLFRYSAWPVRHMAQPTMTMSWD